MLIFVLFSYQISRGAEVSGGEEQTASERAPRPPYVEENQLVVSTGMSLDFKFFVQLKREQSFFVQKQKTVVFSQ